MPLAKVGQLAGHVSPITTQRYSHLQPMDEGELFAALGVPTAAAGSILSRAG